MSAIEEIEPQALKLSDTDRANLALRLLQSLPAVLHNEDEGLAEARRRDAELNTDPDAGISLSELDAAIRSRRET